MALETVRHYQDESQAILHELDGSVPADEAIVVYGSLQRAFGPFSDVDVVSFSPLDVSAAGDIPLQTSQFETTDFKRYTTQSPRGVLLALEHTVIHAESQPDVASHLEATRADVIQNRRPQFLANLLAEQAGDSGRPDVAENTSRYALKRKQEGKRSVMRAFVASLLMHDPELLEAQPVEKFEGLLEQELIDEPTIDSIFAINKLLLDAQQGQGFSRSEWSEHGSRTGRWVQEVCERGEEFVIIHGDSAMLKILDAASAEGSEGQRNALDYAQAPDTEKLVSNAILWRLICNESLDSENLQIVWSMLEKEMRTSKVMGCAAVQHPQFAVLDIDKSSPLFNHSDVQFSWKYSRTHASQAA